MKRSSSIRSLTVTDTHIDVATPESRLRIYLMTDDIIRIRATFADDFRPEHSYMLVTTAWPDELDDFFGDERTRLTPLTPDVEERPDAYVVSTATHTLTLAKDPFGIELRDASGALVYSDLKERSFLADEGRTFHYSTIQEGDHFFGFGEKTGPLDKRLARMRMHNTDACGYDPLRSDPLYKHIPFHIRFNDRTQAAVGLFYNTAYDCAFDMGREWSGYWDRYSTYSSSDPEVDLFLIGGPTIPEVVARYTDLTGKSALPPLAMTGYGHTTMYYTEFPTDCDEQILGFIDRCHAAGIPLDIFLMASGYACMPNAKRYQFRWNTQKFPDPDRFIQAAASRGVDVVPNVKPGFLASHPDYARYAEAGMFIADSTGERPQLERYWGGHASFPDFTSPTARRVWEDALTTSLLERGITGIWDDNCEFDIADGAAVIANDGRPASIASARPIMGTLMARSATHALRRTYPDRRPFVVNRAGSAGVQRYAQTWSGDNRTSWEALGATIPTILGMGLSGCANYGSDIGGWFGHAPSPELLVRWFQLGAFMPRFLTNSANDDNTVTEPTMYPSVTPLIADAVRLRYTLIPQMYALLAEAARTGAPVMRPLVYEFPADPRALAEDRTFLFGPSLLVAPVVSEGATSTTVYLPAGCDWVDYHTLTRYRGGQRVTRDVDLASIPLFVRGGSVTVRSRGVANLHRDVIDTLDVLVEPSQPATFTHYEDDGVSEAYRSGEFRLTTISVTPADAADHTVHVRAGHAGPYRSRVTTLELTVIGGDVAPSGVTLDGDALPRCVDPNAFAEATTGWYADLERHVCRVRFPRPEGDWDVAIGYGPADLVKM